MCFCRDVVEIYLKFFWRFNICDMSGGCISFGLWLYLRYMLVVGVLDVGFEMFFVIFYLLINMVYLFKVFYGGEVYGVIILLL